MTSAEAAQLLRLLARRQKECMTLPDNSNEQAERLLRAIHMGADALTMNYQIPDAELGARGRI